MTIPNAQTIEALLLQLDTLLEVERQALKARDLDGLQQNTQAKELVLAELKQLSRQFSDSFKQDAKSVHAAAEPETPAQSELIHKSTLDIARRVRDSNLVNGKILHRSQQSVREAINVLSGKSLDGLYGHSGQPTADTDANQEIAKA